MFITFEGSECCGKSTQLQKCAEYLQSVNKKYIIVQEPGTTALGKDIRNIVKHATYDIANNAQLLLFLAARVELVNTVILPALKEGTIVLSDRYNTSTWVYQNYNKEEVIDLDSILPLLQLVEPDIQFIINIDIDTFKSRFANRKSDVYDKFDNASIAYHKKIISGYKHEWCKQYAYTTINIDGNDTVENIHNTIIESIDNYATQS